MYAKIQSICHCLFYPYAKIDSNEFGFIIKFAKGLHFVAMAFLVFILINTIIAIVGALIFNPSAVSVSSVLIDVSLTLIFSGWPMLLSFLLIWMVKIYNSRNVH